MTQTKFNKYAYTAQMIEKCSESLKNSHAVFEHGYKTDEQLMTRCSVEDVKGASCFYEEIDIEEIILDMMYEAEGLPQWLCSGKELYFRTVMDYEGCGKKFLKSRSHDWTTGAIPCNKVVLILGKNVDVAGCCTRLFVYTCYPV